MRVIDPLVRLLTESGRNDGFVTVLFLFPAHRAPVSAKIVGMKTGVAGTDIAGTQVHYER